MDLMDITSDDRCSIGQRLEHGLILITICTSHNFMLMLITKLMLIIITKTNNRGKEEENWRGWPLHVIATFSI